MPLPSRDLAGQSAGHEPAGPLPFHLPTERERALDVLLDPALAHVVDLVCWLEHGLVHAADARGHVALAPDGARTLLAGRDPLDDTDPRSDTGYPFAVERLFGLFTGGGAEGRLPDLCVVHTGAHHWPERGGHLGEHGSLNGLQSRATLLLSGAGVRARGVLSDTCRTLDVAPTLLALAGGEHADLPGRVLPWVDPTARPRHVVGLLWDGAPAGELLAMEAAGELPAVSRLLAAGCALAGGAVAEFPSVTLVNHTSALTGQPPGVHGIVNNAFYDRDSATQAVPNSAAEWHTATRWLAPGVRTVFERLPAGATSACVNEPVDVGAGYSTFALIRALGDGGSEVIGALPSALEDPHTTREHAEHRDYAWASQVDASGLQQVLDLWRTGTPPSFTWWNTTLTDSGHHAGGPGSAISRAALRDADRRLGAWLDVLDERGLWGDVAVLLTADHGMERADERCTGDWDEALAAAGVRFRDEAYGFLYLGV